MRRAIAEANQKIQAAQASAKAMASRADHIQRELDCATEELDSARGLSRWPACLSAPADSGGSLRGLQRPASPSRPPPTGLARATAVARGSASDQGGARGRGREEGGEETPEREGEEEADEGKGEEGLEGQEARNAEGLKRTRETTEAAWEDGPERGCKKPRSGRRRHNVSAAGGGRGPGQDAGGRARASSSHGGQAAISAGSASARCGQNDVIGRGVGAGCERQLTTGADLPALPSPPCPEP